MKEQTIEIIKHDNSLILIKKRGKSYWAEIIPRNKLIYWLELFSDWMGFRYKHPVYLNMFMRWSLKEIKKEIEYYIRMETVLKTYDDRDPYVFKWCQFCNTMLREEGSNDNNAFFLSCGNHKQLAQLQTERFFKENPDYTKWRLRESLSNLIHKCKTQEQ